MDDLQRQKDRIDEEARKAKEEADSLATEERQILADTEAEDIVKEAEAKAQQIKDDAQK